MNEEIYCLLVEELRIINDEHYVNRRPRNCLAQRFQHGGRLLHNPRLTHLCDINFRVCTGQSLGNSVDDVRG